MRPRQRSQPPANRAPRKIGLTFRLTLREEPSAAGPPVYVRLRRALKILGRGFGLRCIAITEVKPVEKNCQSLDTDADNC